VNWRRAYVVLSRQIAMPCNGALNRAAAEQSGAIYEVYGMGIRTGKYVLAVLACSGLAGCFGSGETGSVAGSGESTDPVAATGAASQAPSTSAPPTAPAPTTNPGSDSATVSTAGQNTAPVFLYAPGTSVMAGTRYGYRAAARDADGDSLTWSIANQPGWADFDPATGDLVGTPGTQHVGGWNNIIITVSDGKTSRSMTAFGITVSQAVTNGTAALSWAPPVENEDGSALTDLAGYRVYGGASANSLTLLRTISSAGITTAVIDGLATGTLYFAVSAFTSAGAESDWSSLGTKNIL
jgi:hypothetical protein